MPGLLVLARSHQIQMGMWPRKLGDEQSHDDNDGNDNDGGNDDQQRFSVGALIPSHSETLALQRRQTELCAEV